LRSPHAVDMANGINLRSLHSVDLVNGFDLRSLHGSVRTVWLCVNGG
jgi:hypothetical protein